MTIPLRDFASAGHDVKMYSLRRLTKSKEVDAFRARHYVKNPFRDTKTSYKISVRDGRKLIELRRGRLSFKNQVSGHTETISLAQLLEIRLINFELIHVITSTSRTPRLVD